MAQALSEYRQVMNKPHAPLENYLAGANDSDTYRTGVMQYMASGGKVPGWYTGNFDKDKPNIDAAVNATMSPQQQLIRQEAQTRMADSTESREARLKLQQETERRRAQDSAAKREGLQQQRAIPSKGDRLQAHEVLGGIMGEGYITAPQHVLNAAAEKAASIAKSQMSEPGAVGVDYESLLQDAFNDMIAKGELKLPDKGTYLGDLTGGLIGKESKPAGFSPQGVQVLKPAAQASTSPVAVKSINDYNALPAGALYVHPSDGKTYRKK